MGILPYLDAYAARHERISNLLPYADMKTPRNWILVDQVWRAEGKVIINIGDLQAQGENCAFLFTVMRKNIFGKLVTGYQK